MEFVCEKFPELTGALKGDKAEPAIFDNSKIKQFVPDFACRKNFAAGIRESIAWLRAHPEDQAFNPQTDSLIDQVVKSWRCR